MRSRKTERWQFSTRDRAALGVAGLTILLLGLGTLLRGHLEYPNYWGGAVFAPFAILVGLLVIVVAVVQGRRG
jgi:hypothetical protein